MGNTNATQTANNMTEAVSNTILSSLQSITDTLMATQEFKASCDAAVAEDSIKYKADCINNAIAAGRFNADEITEMCGMVGGCDGSNIKLSQTIYIVSSVDQQASLSATIEDDVSSSLSQFKQNDPSTDQLINAAAIAISKTKADLSQFITTQMATSQVLDLTNYSVKVITMDQAVSKTSDFIQKNSVVMSAVNKAAVAITQSSINTMTWISYVGVIIIVLFILIFMILMLSKSKDLQQFFHSVLPYVVWFIIVTLITIIHILVKPAYVSYTLKGDTKKHLDISKLLMWMFIYYLASGIIVYVVFKILRRNESGGGYEQQYEPDSEPRSEPQSEPTSNKSSSMPEELGEY